jgi:hypothetical protein
MSRFPEQVKRLTSKRQAAEKLYKQLDLWAAVAAQGIVVENVASFGFDPKLLTDAQVHDIRFTAHLGFPDPISGVREHPDRPYTGNKLPNGHYECRAYNYVRLKDGSRRTLDPMLKACTSK